MHQKFAFQERIDASIEEKHGLWTPDLHLRFMNMTR